MSFTAMSRRATGWVGVAGSAESCLVPCSLRVAPGTHRFVVPDGFDQEVTVDRDLKVSIDFRARTFHVLPPERVSFSPGHDGARLRFGLAADLGLGRDIPVSEAADGTLTFSLGVHLRFGVQIVQRWALYYQASGVFGAVLEYEDDGCSGGFCISIPQARCRSVLLHASSVLVEATLSDRLQIALGPSVLVGSTGGKRFLGYGGTARLSGYFRQGYEPGATRRQGFSAGLQVQVGVVPRGAAYWDVGPTFGYDFF